jgi:hypothetical protein
VVRVSCYRYRGPGFDSRSYQIFWEVECLERGPLSLLRQQNAEQWRIRCYLKPETFCGSAAALLQSHSNCHFTLASAYWYWKWQPQSTSLFSVRFELSVEIWAESVQEPADGTLELVVRMYVWGGEGQLVSGCPLESSPPYGGEWPTVVRRLFL